MKAKRASHRSHAAQGPFNRSKKYTIPNQFVEIKRRLKARHFRGAFRMYYRTFSWPRVSYAVSAFNEEWGHANSYSGFHLIVTICRISELR